MIRARTMMHHRRLWPGANCKYSQNCHHHEDTLYFDFSLMSSIDEVASLIRGDIQLFSETFYVKRFCNFVFIFRIESPVRDSFLFSLKPITSSETAACPHQDSCVIDSCNTPTLRTWDSRHYRDIKSRYSRQAHKLCPCQSLLLFQ